MWTEIVEALAHLDWFERVDELGRMICGVRSWRFAIPRDCGWSGWQIEQMLQRHGIKLWGRNFNKRQLFFRVKREQANWAEYLLWRHGIPVQSEPFNPRNAEVQALEAMEGSRRAEGEDLLNGLLDQLDQLLG